MNIAMLLPSLLLLCGQLSAADSETAALNRLGATVEQDPSLPAVVSYKMKNGLQLLILRKDFVPTISFTMLFRAGNVDSPKDKTGLAHLFEHMAFKGTKKINSKNYSKERKMLERVDEAAGRLIAEQYSDSPDQHRLEELSGMLKKAQEEAEKYIEKDEYWKIYNTLGEYGMNAMTSADYTGYVVSLPSSRLEAWMAIESDRFRNPVLREFYKERDVVMEERRMGEAEPGRVIWEALLSASFSAHPYGQPVIGWMDDIKRLTRKDAENFYSRYYVPNNATLAIVGDVNPAEVIKLAEKYFSAWKKSELPEQHYTKEPEQKGERRVEINFKASPSIMAGFHNPGMTHPDMPALIMASEVLSNGKTGRFYKNLVDGKGLALYASSYPSMPGSRYPGLFTIAAAPKAPHTPEELDAAVMEEIKKLASEPPTRWEMDKILNNYDAEMIKQLESNSGIGMNLAHSQQIMGDWRYDWKLASALRKVTPEEVSDAAARYLVPSNRTVVFLREGK